jgi:hypothetical protein
MLRIKNVTSLRINFTQIVPRYRNAPTMVSLGKILSISAKAHNLLGILLTPAGASGVQ